MKRINYLVAPSERVFGDALRGGVSPRLRLGLITVGGAIAAIALPFCAESARLHALQTAGAAYQEQLDRTALDLSRVRRSERDVSRLRATTEQVTAVRRSGTLRANEIAQLGNALPNDAWLTALRHDGDALELEGGSRRLTTVAAAIVALAQLPAYAGARLVSAYGGDGRAQVSYAIVLERRR